MKREGVHGAGLQETEETKIIMQRRRCIVGPSEEGPAGRGEGGGGGKERQKKLRR